MYISEYLQLPAEDRKEIAIQPVTGNTPFFLERLQTALKFKNPLAVMFDKRLVEEYYNLISKY